MRVNSIPGRTKVKGASSTYHTIQRNKDDRFEVRIGNEALVIEHDFQKVTSQLGPVQDPQTMYMFDSAQTVQSLIPGVQEFSIPLRVELWTFK